MLEGETFNTFFYLLKLVVKFLLILPLVMYVVGFKTNLLFLRELAFALFLVGIILSLILTFIYYLE